MQMKAGTVLFQMRFFPNRSSRYFACTRCVLLAAVRLGRINVFAKSVSLLVVFLGTHEYMGCHIGKSHPPPDICRFLRPSVPECARVRPISDPPKIPPGRKPYVSKPENKYVFEPFGPRGVRQRQTKIEFHFFCATTGAKVSPEISKKKLFSKSFKIA